MALFYYTTTTTIIIIIGKDAAIQEFMYRDATNVEHEMYNFTGNNWSHRNDNKRFKEKFVTYTIKAFNRFTTKDNCTGNITHYKECTAV